MGRRIRHEVDRRCLTPYLARHDHWWLFDTPERPVNNWTAVCNAGVAGAAIHLEQDRPAGRDPGPRRRSLGRLPFHVRRRRRLLGRAGYWSYGSATIPSSPTSSDSARAGRWTSSKASRCAGSRVPVAHQLSPGLYVNFSDCDRHVGLSPAHCPTFREVGSTGPRRLVSEQRGGGERERS